MLIRDPKRRLIANEVLCHRWVQVDGVAPDKPIDSVVLSRADVDNSGTTDYREFVAATLHINKIEKENHLFAVFSYYNKDGNGYISADELQHACEEFGIDAHPEELIQDVDQDNIDDEYVFVDNTQVEGTSQATKPKKMKYVQRAACWVDYDVIHIDKVRYSKCKNCGTLLETESGRNDILGLQISTVALEAAFSISRRILDQYRTNLSANIAEVLVCTHDWVRKSRKPIVDNIDDILKDDEVAKYLEEAINNRDGNGKQPINIPK
ncbi:unnamed protein product [Lactuca saligna]|uniref:EF-hand domain-containing protein n=1 Tax=Lactuca saligna TaxID=75948 RepID=A0AA36DVR5_LACSI|nr:unnamed protein product [Lactuca saligna]